MAHSIQADVRGISIRKSECGRRKIVVRCQVSGQKSDDRRRKGKMGISNPPPADKCRRKVFYRSIWNYKSQSAGNSTLRDFAVQYFAVRLF